MLFLFKIEIFTEKRVVFSVASASLRSLEDNLLGIWVLKAGLAYDIYNDVLSDLYLDVPTTECFQNKQPCLLIVTTTPVTVESRLSLYKINGAAFIIIVVTNKTDTRYLLVEIGINVDKISYLKMKVGIK